MPGTTTAAHTGGVPTATPAGAPTAVASAVFSVPAETVWAYRLDFANLPGLQPRRDWRGSAWPTGRATAWGACTVAAPATRSGWPTRDGRARARQIELWTVEAVAPTLVAAGMTGASEAYEEFVLRPLDGGGCEATLTLWVTLPDGLPDDVVAAAGAGSLEQISKELRLMKEVLEGGAAQLV